MERSDRRVLSLRVHVQPRVSLSHARIVCQILRFAHLPPFPEGKIGISTYRHACLCAYRACCPSYTKNKTYITSLLSEEHMISRFAWWQATPATRLFLVLLDSFDLFSVCFFYRPIGRSVLARAGSLNRFFWGDRLAKAKNLHNLSILKMALRYIAKAAKMQP